MISPRCCSFVVSNSCSSPHSSPVPMFSFSYCVYFLPQCNHAATPPPHDQQQEQRQRQQQQQQQQQQPFASGDNSGGNSGGNYPPHPPPYHHYYHHDPGGVMPPGNVQPGTGLPIRVDAPTGEGGIEAGTGAGATAPSPVPLPLAAVVGAMTANGEEEAHGAGSSGDQKGRSDTTVADAGTGRELESDSYLPHQATGDGQAWRNNRRK